MFHKVLRILFIVRVLKNGREHRMVLWNPLAWVLMLGIGLIVGIGDGIAGFVDYVAQTVKDAKDD
jgi:hypothetical protein